MNRLSPLASSFALSAPPGKAEPPVAIEFGQVQRDLRHEAPHALFVPMHYEPNYAYPLLVWLHGPGDDERQLQRIMPLVSLRNYVAVAPRCATPKTRQGQQWRQHTADIDRAESAIFRCIDQVSARFHIAPARIFLGGYACGGTMAFRIGLRHPRRFAGALSIGGTFPEGQMPLQFLNDARKLPFFIAQGRDGERYSIERTCDELRLFHSAGLSVTLRQYPCGDELTTHMLGDMDRWMMELVTGVEQSPPTEMPGWESESN